MTQFSTSFLHSSRRVYRMKVRSRLSRAILYAVLAAALVIPMARVFVVQAASGISLRSWTTRANGAGSTSLTIAKPSGVAAGDVLVAQVVVHLASTSITAPSGWSLIKSTSSGTNLQMSTYYHVAASSEPSSYKWTLSATVPATGGISAWIGVSNTNPIDVSSEQANSASTASFAQVTTTVPYDMVLAFVGVARNTTVTPPYK